MLGIQALTINEHGFQRKSEITNNRLPQNEEPQNGYPTPVVFYRPLKEETATSRGGRRLCWIATEIEIERYGAGVVTNTSSMYHPARF